MEELDLKELLSYFKSKMLWIVLTMALVMVLGNIVTTFTRTPMYRSSTSIVLVSEGNNQTTTMNDLQVNKNLVGTYSEIIKSRKVSGQVKKNLGLTYSVGELSKHISVSAIENTEIIKISVSNANNREAAKIANEIANVFIVEIKEIYNLNNVSIVDKAEAINKPYNINYIKDNLLYALIGLAISSGILFISFYFDTSIKTSEEIEKKLGLTILGIVPKVERN